jgi:hypothetical protein
LLQVAQGQQIQHILAQTAALLEAHSRQTETRAASREQQTIQACAAAADDISANCTEQPTQRRKRRVRLSCLGCA